MHNWMEEHAKSCFREWKCELHKHYQKWKHLGRNGTPSELADREDQWIWLCGHFESERFLRQSKAGKRAQQCLTRNHHCGSMSMLKRWSVEEKKGVQFPPAKVYADAYPGATTEIAAVEKAGAEAIQTIAEERYPDLPPEERSLHEIQITDMISRALIMSKALPRGKNKHYVRGTGRVGNGLLTRVFGTSLPTPKMSEEMQLQKADEAQRVKKNAEEAAERIKKNEEHTAALEKMVSSMKSVIRFLVTKLSPDQCDSDLLASLPPCLKMMTTMMKMIQCPPPKPLLCIPMEVA